MLEIFATTSATLAIVLYLQARQSAREIRRNRENAPGNQNTLLLHPTDR